LFSISSLKFIFHILSRDIIIIYNYCSVIIVFGLVETAPTSKDRSPLIFAKEKVRVAESERERERKGTLGGRGEDLNSGTSIRRCWCYNRIPCRRFGHDDDDLGLAESPREFPLGDQSHPRTNPLRISYG